MIFLAAALSRSCDLTAAFQHVAARADAFCSNRDTMVLAIGTFPLGA